MLPATVVDVLSELDSPALTSDVEDGRNPQQTESKLVALAFSWRRRCESASVLQCGEETFGHTVVPAGKPSALRLVHRTPRIRYRTLRIHTVVWVYSTDDKLQHRTIVASMAPMRSTPPSARSHEQQPNHNRRFGQHNSVSLSSRHHGLYSRSSHLPDTATRFHRRATPISDGHPATRHNLLTNGTTKTNGQHQLRLHRRGC